MEKYYFIQEKISDVISLQYQLSEYRFKDQKIVFTDGCYDLLHRGHIKFLAQASDLGDKLIVGIHSDSSASQKKGRGRPVQDHKTRAIILASLQFVDHVIIFEEDTPLKLIQMIHPDILVKGSDRLIYDTAGTELVPSKGGKIVTLDVLKGYSVSSLLEKIKAL